MFLTYCLMCTTILRDACGNQPPKIFGKVARTCFACCACSDIIRADWPGSFTCRPIRARSAASWNKRCIFSLRHASARELLFGSQESNNKVRSFRRTCRVVCERQRSGDGRQVEYLSNRLPARAFGSKEPRGSDIQGRPLLIASCFVLRQENVLPKSGKPHDLRFKSTIAVSAGMGPSLNRTNICSREHARPGSEGFYKTSAAHPWSAQAVHNERALFELLSYRSRPSSFEVTRGQREQTYSM